MTHYSVTESMPVDVRLAALHDQAAASNWLDSLIPRRAENLEVWSIQDPLDLFSVRLEYDWDPPAQPAKVRRRASRSKA